MWKDFPAAAVRGRRLPRPRLFAPGLRPLDAARGRRALGRSTSCTARRTRCCRRCCERWASTATTSPGCSATATAARSRCCTRRASRSAWPAPIVLAPHILVEDVSVASIEQAREAYLDDRPARSAWRATTTTPIRPSGAGTTSGWTRRSALDHRGRDRRHRAARCSRCRASTTSTARWSRSAASRAACRRPQLLELPDCGHSPHRDQPDAVIAAVRDFHCTRRPSTETRQP